MLANIEVVGKHIVLPSCVKMIKELTEGYCIGSINSTSTIARKKYSPL